MRLADKFKGCSLTRFLEEVTANNCKWFAKRLSGNDTSLNGSHQVGVYLSADVAQQMFPKIYRRDTLNPDISLKGCFFPDTDYTAPEPRAIYYNNKFFGKTRNEFRITSWGGQDCPVQDKENTGSIFVFALQKKGDEYSSVGWVTKNASEEDLVASWIGEEVEPGFFRMPRTFSEEEAPFPCEWIDAFPSGREIFSYITELIPSSSAKSADRLLLKRRLKEFEVFEAIERAHVMPRISAGFTSVLDFITLANSVANRRKSRTGLSLELNLEVIFRERNLDFETQVKTENQKKPDFLFPSEKAYHDQHFPEQSLRMMAAKTCCKDRWRQVINEADRIKTKHLFTLQEGVSVNQMAEMQSENIILVVPDKHITSFAQECRKDLITLEDFIAHISNLQCNESK